MLSKFTTQSLGTRSCSAVNSSSETRSRRVRVSAATVTDPIRSATGSRVKTSTGRSPPGVAANQISPRFIVRAIGPVRPVLRRTPISDLAERELRLGGGKLLVAITLALAAKRDEVAVKRHAQQFGAIHPESVGPCLSFRRFVIPYPEAQHRHTERLPRITVAQAHLQPQAPARAARRSPPRARPRPRTPRPRTPAGPRPRSPRPRTPAGPRPRTPRPRTVWEETPK